MCLFSNQFSNQESKNASDQPIKAGKVFYARHTYHIKLHRQILEISKTG